MHNMQCIFNDCIEIRSRDNVQYVISFLPPAFPSFPSSAAQIHLLSGFPHCNGMLTFYFSGFCFQMCYFQLCNSSFLQRGARQGERGASGSEVWPGADLNCCTLDGKEKLKRISISVRLCFFLREDEKMRKTETMGSSETFGCILEQNVLGDGSRALCLCAWMKR